MEGAENNIPPEAYDDLLNQLAEKDKDASFDSLTGLMRRGLFTEEVRAHLLNPQSQPVSLIIFDIDHFKNVNDSYGHDIGDIVLKRVAEVISGYNRGHDLACRWGGEEMVLEMVEAEEDAALHKADFIRDKINQIDFSDIHPKLKDFKITVSAGVASSRQLPDFESLFKGADDALYSSKNSGRNKVIAQSKLS
jgi:diguanylate cyclase (GGDEF)-like protein